MKRILLTLFLFFPFAFQSQASHIIGGEMHYEYMGADTYKITLKIYRNCFDPLAEYDDPLILNIYDNAGNTVTSINIPFPGSDTLLNDANNPCLIAPTNVCVEEADYETTIYLPPIAGGYDLVWQSCCRNNSILNIINAGSTGASYSSHIPGLADENNSDPKFIQFPPTIICAAFPILFDHSAFDADGDSLVYSLCAPYDDNNNYPPFDFIQYDSSLTNYSGQFPIDGNPVIAIDSVTGMLTGVPLTIGQFVVGVSVKEYRNGILLSDHKRDFQFNVANCSPSVIAITTPIIVNCQDLSINFDNSSIGGIHYHWDFGTGISSDTSDLLSPNFSYPDTGTYHATLIVNPNTNCSDTSLSLVIVIDTVIAEAYPDSSFLCPGESVTLIGSGGLTYSWSPSIGLSATNTASVIANPVSTTDYIFTTFVGSCFSSKTITVIRNQYPTLSLPNQLDLCFGDSVQLFPVGCNKFTWSPNNAGLSNTDIADPWASPTVNTKYFLMATDTNACHILLYDSISINLLINTHTIVNDKTIILGTSTSIYASGGASYSWIPTESLNDPNIQYPIASPTKNTTYTAIITFADGCTVQDTAVVAVDVNPILSFPNAFSPNQDGMNDLFRPMYKGYITLKSFRVYNRWGQKVFETTNADEGWDGSYKGEQQAVGTYSYYFEANATVGNKTFMEQGNFTLIR